MIGQELEEARTGTGFVSTSTADTLKTWRGAIRYHAQMKPERDAIFRKREEHRQMKRRILNAGRPSELACTKASNPPPGSGEK